MRRHLLAPPRGLALTALALLGVLALLVGFVSTLFGLLRLPVMLRRLPNLGRSLASSWCDAPSVAVPYRPAPAPPRADAAGLYRIGNQLYRSPRMVALQQRLDWLVRDSATYRDIWWLLFSPLVSMVTVLLPTALVATGAGLLVLGRSGVDVPRVLFALVLAATGLLSGPKLLTLYGRWTRLLLAPRAHARPGQQGWTRLLARQGRAVVRLLLAAVLSVLCLLVAVGNLLCLVPGLGWPLPHFQRLSRALVGLRRRQMSAWAGVAIDSPYLPPPQPPQRREDGMYLAARTLYSSPRPVMRLRRYAWAMKDAATWRDLLWLLCEPVAALVAGLLVAATAGYGFVMLVWPWIWVLPLRPWVSYEPDRGWQLLTDLMPVLQSLPTAAGPVLGLLLTAAGCVAAPWLLWLHARWSRILLAPTKAARLSLRVQELADSRDEASDEQASVLRRIERDLHDGAQANWVAVGMKLDAVEQLIDEQPEAAKQLVVEARDSLGKGLRELRQLVRGIHPPVLAERGLGDAVLALTLDSPLEVDTAVDLPARAEAAVESAVYFTVSELLTNAAKHSRAERGRVELYVEDGRLRGAVCDDGRGGADPEGSGLRGLQGRLAPFDGTLSVTSPRGGPTRVDFELSFRHRPAP